MPAPTRALILRAFEFGESSQVVHLFTEREGRVHAIAKGARRLNGAFHGGMDLLVLGNLVLYGRRGTNQLRTLASFTGITQFAGLRRRLGRFHNAIHASALLLGFAREEQPHPDLFELTVSLLRLLEQADDDDADALGLAYETMLLRLVGFHPELTRCVECGRAARNITRTRLSPRHGGLLCRGCRSADPEAAALTGRAVASLVGLGRGPLARATGLPADRRLRHELREGLDRWTTAVLDRPLRTAQYL